MNNNFEKPELKPPFPVDKLQGLSEEFADVFVDKMNPSQIFSMLVILFNERIKRMNPQEAMKNYAESRLFTVSEIDPVTQVKLDALLYDSLPESYRPIIISPVSPLGGSSTLNEIDSKTILQTIKSSEVVADASVTLAMESTKIRKSIGLKQAPVVNLATSQRELRLQSFEDPNFKSHFATFTLTSAGRDTGRYSFEQNQTHEHVDYFLSALHKLNEAGDYELNDITVEISDMSMMDLLLENGKLARDEITASIRGKSTGKMFENHGISLPSRLDTLSDFTLPPDLSFLNVPIQVLKKWETIYLPGLKQKFPNIKFVFRFDRIGGLGYFDSMCFKIRATNKEGEQVSLVDGGASDWTAKLSSDDSERFFGSGLGSEILMLKFKN